MPHSDLRDVSGVPQHSDEAAGAFVLLTWVHVNTEQRASSRLIGDSSHSVEWLYTKVGPKRETSAILPEVSSSERSLALPVRKGGSWWRGPGQV